MNNLNRVGSRVGSIVALLATIYLIIDSVHLPLFVHSEPAPQREQYRHWQKLDADGNTMAPDAGPWQCVVDHRSGLVWENKSRDEGIHHGRWTYVWQGQASRRSGEGSCAGLSRCDVSEFVRQANLQRWCGFNDWRVPQLAELQTLLDHSYPPPGPLVCPCFLPNTARSSYWATTADRQRRYVGLNFQTGESNVFPDYAALYLRLVRGPAKL